MEDLNKLVIHCGHQLKDGSFYNWYLNIVIDMKAAAAFATPLQHLAFELGPGTFIEVRRWSDLELNLPFSPGGPSSAEPEHLFGSSSERVRQSRDRNPHLQKTRQGPTPTVAPQGDKITYTKGEFDRIVLSYYDLLRNLSPNAKSAVQADPDKDLAVLPHGGGRAFLLTHPLAAKTVQQNLIDLRVASVSDAEAGPKLLSNLRDWFDKPWVILAEGVMDAMRQFLLWQQTFALSKDSAWHVMPFDRDLMPWLITTISSSAIDNGSLSKVELLCCIKRALVADSVFLNMCDRHLAAQGIAGSVHSRTIKALSTFDLMPVEFTNTKAVHEMVMVLTGEPITRDKDDHFTVSFDTVVTGCHWDPCTGCKSELHPVDKCPFAKTFSWFGPSAEDMKQMVTVAKSLSHKDDVSTRKPAQRPEQGGKANTRA
ncbi:hypothetical protein NEOLEDRAFT_1146775 [Neolentinus lepideus HHB14362 ss-1]|uniref:Uncharacterized protein n=1 Tax=Neolentinus lepideus HHB14362 ss-1 TaxID=1314782 RepID=A0A165TW44_9AGAM|nr:hypothetical protein NEOLEDRAFT_1146775 [Neolentinus lepideus HHB14362 ss-1]